DRVAAFGRASAGEGDFLHEGGAAEFDVGGLEHGAVVEHVALRGQGAGRGQGDEQGGGGAGEVAPGLPPVRGGRRASGRTRRLRAAAVSGRAASSSFFSARLTISRRVLTASWVWPRASKASALRR